MRKARTMRIDLSKLPATTGEDVQDMFLADALVDALMVHGQHLVVAYDPWGEEWAARFSADALPEGVDGGASGNTMAQAIIAAAQQVDDIQNLLPNGAVTT